MEAEKHILFASQFSYMYYQYVSDAFKDYSLHITQDSKETVSYLKQNTPNVVILGETQEKQHTLKLCKAIRKSSRLASTKILLLVPDTVTLADIDDETKTVTDSILNQTQKPSRFVQHIGKLLKASELEQTGINSQNSDVSQIPTLQQVDPNLDPRLDPSPALSAQTSLQEGSGQEETQETLKDTSQESLNPIVSFNASNNASSNASNNTAIYSKKPDKSPETRSEPTTTAVHMPAMHMPESTRMHELNATSSGTHQDIARAIPQIPISATNTYEISFPEEAPAKTIAIIEDNASIAFLEKSILERQGYNTIQISDAPQARDFVDTNFDMADLILLDLNLPGGSGFEILRRIRSFSRKPVIIVSGLKQSENIKRGLSLGAQDYLTKPMNPQELVLRVSQHIKNFT